MGYGNNPNLVMANFLIKERPGKIEDLRENKFLFAQDGFLIRVGPRETRSVPRNGVRALGPL
jgi:hypothetical protein